MMKQTSRTSFLEREEEKERVCDLCVSVCICVCVRLCARACACAHAPQHRMEVRGPSLEVNSPSIMWVLEMELRSSGLAAATLTYSAIMLALQSLSMCKTETPCLLRCMASSPPRPVVSNI